MASNLTLLNSNLTNTSIASMSAFEVTRDWIVLFLYLITAILAIVGNIFVCLVIHKKKHMRSTTYILILNMAISDIIGGVVIPSQWLFCSTYILDMGSIGQRMCGICKSTQIVSYYVSTFSMTAIALDRYRLICKPLSEPMKPKLPIIIIWISSLILTANTFVQMRVSEYFSPTQGLIGCRMIFPLKSKQISLLLRTSRVTLILVTQYVIPLSLTAYFYAMVAYTVWQRERIGTVSVTKKKEFDKNKEKTIKMLIIVTVLFALSWLPTRVTLFLKFYTNLLSNILPRSKCNSSTYNAFSYLLGISSVSYNPFIYCYFNTDFKSEAIYYCNRFIPWLKINAESKRSEEYWNSTNSNNATSTTNEYPSTSV